MIRFPRNGIPVVEGLELLTPVAWVSHAGEASKRESWTASCQQRPTFAMLGYLNVPKLFTEDGWFVTGDEYLKILG